MAEKIIESKFIYFLQNNNFNITYLDKACFTLKLAQSYQSKNYPEFINDIILIGIYQIIHEYIYKNNINLDPLKVKEKV